jgi:hypothetical protein
MAATDATGAALVAGAITGAAPSATTFTAMAAGFVGGTTIDKWTITDAKVVSNTTPGGY